MTSPEPHHHLILWDIDGTLVSNNDSDEKLFVEAMEAVLGPVNHVVHPYRHGKTDLQQVIEYILGNGGGADHFKPGMRALVRASEAHFERPGERVAHAGVTELLKAVADAGHVSALLTGNGPERARLKLLSAAIDPSTFDFALSFFGHDSPSRPELTTLAADRAGKSGLRPVIIGDTVADGEAAHSAGIPFIGVATGVYGVDRLAEVPHELVVSDLDVGARAILDWLTRH